MVLCTLIHRGNIVANNDQTEITEVALATDAVNMVISPEVCEQISYKSAQ